MSNTEEPGSLLLDILKEAISIEIYGQEYYSIFADIVQEESASALFRGLAIDEGEHREIIEKEYERTSGNKADVDAMAEEYRKKARSIFPEPLQPMNITETKDVLELGIRTEERSIEFYSRGANRTDNTSVKKLFLKLTEIEKGHKLALEDALYYFEQDGSWYGYSPPTIEG